MVPDLLKRVVMLANGFVDLLVASPLVLNSCEWVVETWSCCIEFLTEYVWIDWRTLEQWPDTFKKRIASKQASGTELVPYFDTSPLSYESAVGLNRLGSCRDKLRENPIDSQKSWNLDPSHCCSVAAPRPIAS